MPRALWKPWGGGLFRMSLFRAKAYGVGGGIIINTD